MILLSALYESLQIFLCFRESAKKEGNKENRNTKPAMSYYVLSLQWFIRFRLMNSRNENSLVNGILILRNVAIEVCGLSSKRRKRLMELSVWSLTGKPFKSSLNIPAEPAVKPWREFITTFCYLCPKLAAYHCSVICCLTKYESTCIFERQRVNFHCL